MRREILLVMAMMIIAMVSAQTPNTISFQGNLTIPGSSTPISNGTYSMDFALYDNVNNLMWSETQPAVQVTNGFINVQLGSVTPLEISDFYQPLELEITIESETLSPRIALQAVPFAQTSKAVVGTDSIIFRMAGQKAGIVDQTNTALGRQSLASNTDGDENVAVGSNVLSSNTTGFRNIGLGFGSLTSNIMGNSNVAVGVDALNQNLEGSENAALGTFALQTNNGYGNTGIGTNALRAHSSGNFNISVGYNSGSGAAGVDQTSGSYNTFIGADASVGVDGLTNATAIGAQAVVSQSNSMVLGDGNVNVGIGTSAPAEKLSVIGNVQADAYQYNTTVTKYFTIPAAAMILSQATYSTSVPDNLGNTHNDIRNTLRSFQIGSNFVGVGGGNIDISAHMTAPVYLPDGAVVTALEALIFENNATYDVSVNLISTPFNVQNTETIQTTATSTGSPGHTLISSTGLSIPIDTQNNAYYIRFDTQQNSSGNMVFYHARITYEVNGVD